MLDVCIIGAGLSGLEAAYTLQQAGLTVIVVEARDRVGGKVWSVPLTTGRGYADLGAAWVNAYTQPRIASYLRRFGLRTVEQRLGERAVMEVDARQRIEFPFGITPEFSVEEKGNLELIRDHIQERSLSGEPLTPEDDAVSLDQYVRDRGALPKTAQMINLWVKVMHGLESTEESAAWFINYCRCNEGLFSIRADDKTGGNYQRLVGGTQAIAEGIASLIGKTNIQLSSPVASISDFGFHVTITTKAGVSIPARKCILSIPSTLYRDIQISPPLPPSLQTVTDGTRLGDYNKVLLCYHTPWWRELGYNGFFMSYTGPITLARDTSVDETGQFSLTCFVNGEFGRQWGKRHAHERRAAVIQQVARVYHVGADSEAWRPMEVFEQIWKNEEYSKGALAPVTALGHYLKYASVYGKPIGNLHFTGTEYGRHWKGYMEGALCSGQDTAAEVVRACQPDTTVAPQGGRANVRAKL